LWDDLTSGHLDNIRHLSARAKLIFSKRICGNPADPCRHAGRGRRFPSRPRIMAGVGTWIFTKPARLRTFSSDGLVFAEALKAKVKKVVFASSGCVYPNFLQSDTEKEIYSSRRSSPKVRTTLTILTAGRN